jgi:hypothetical protein
MACPKPTIVALAGHARTMTKRFVLELDAETILRLQVVDNVQIQCMEGALWITHDEHPRDIVLRRGEGCWVRRKGAVIQAVPYARVAILGSAPCLHSAAFSSAFALALKAIWPPAGVGGGRCQERGEGQKVLHREEA